MTGTAWIDALIAAAAAVTALGVLWRAVRGLRRFGRRVEDFLGDWFGEPERPGVAAKPGVMARLENVETDMATIKKELSVDSGQSVKDHVLAMRAEFAEHVRQHEGS